MDFRSDEKLGWYELLSAVLGLFLGLGCLYGCGRTGSLVWFYCSRVFFWWFRAKITQDSN